MFWVDVIYYTYASLICLLNFLRQGFIKEFNFFMFVYFSSFTDHVCEGENFHLECPTGKLISITSALYGRQTAFICNDRPISSTDCAASNSFDIVREKCDGFQSCDIAASNSVFGDPCRSVYKYLAIEYECEGRSPKEHGTKSLCKYKMHTLKMFFKYIV